MSILHAVVAAIEESEQHGRAVRIEGLTGYSGDKLIGFLQRCAGVIGARGVGCYLELGVFQGLTFVSVAASAPDLQCYGIDDFSQFDPEGTNQNTVIQHLQKSACRNARLINADFEHALLRLESEIGDTPVGLYFIDGPHDYRSQYLSLEFAKKWLAEDAVIVVDDSNYEHVRRANRDWLLANPDFALLYEAYTDRHPGNMDESMKKEAMAGWWNGVNIIVKDTERRYEHIYPPVDESRERYFNDHIVHASKHASMAPRIMNALGRGGLQGLWKFINTYLAMRICRSDPYRSMNTRSDGLPVGRYAPRTTSIKETFSP